MKNTVPGISIYHPGFSGIDDTRKCGRRREGNGSSSPAGSPYGANQARDLTEIWK